jgi:GDP-D-mannose dehydratase
VENRVEKALKALNGPILITGHTGFKGTWLTLLLEQLGFEVVGFSLPAEEESLYQRMQRVGKIPESFIDIRNFELTQKKIKEFAPTAVIHMAAQPLVLNSYNSPRETFDINGINASSDWLSFIRQFELTAKIYNLSDEKKILYLYVVHPDLQNKIEQESFDSSSPDFSFENVKVQFGEKFNPTLNYILHKKIIKDNTQLNVYRKNYWSLIFY